MSQRTENETLIYMYLNDKLGRMYEECVFKKNWVFDWRNWEAESCYCFAVAIKYRGDLEELTQTSTETCVFIAIATDENIDLVTSKVNGLMTEFFPKPEIIVVIRADRPHVDIWTLISGEYQHSSQDDGDIEFDALGGDFHWYFDDVYEDVDGIYEQVAA